MPVKSFRLVSKSDREFLIDRVTAAIESWQQEWFATDVSVSVDVIDDTAAPNRTWKSYKHAGESVLSISLPMQSDDDIATWLTGDRISGAVETRSWAAPILRDQFVRSFIGAIFDGKGSAKSGPIVEMDTDVALLANAAMIKCVLGDAELRLALSLEFLDAHLPANTRGSKSMARISEALGEGRVKLGVVMGQAELTLDELQTLGVGDVIRFDRKVDHPLPIQLVGPENETIGFGFLGTRGERKAVQLTATDKSFNRG